VPSAAGPGNRKPAIMFLACTPFDRRDRRTGRRRHYCATEPGDALWWSAETGATAAPVTKSDRIVAGVRPIDHDDRQIRQTGCRAIPNGGRYRRSIVASPVSEGVKCYPSDQLQSLQTRMPVLPDDDVIVHRDAQWRGDIDDRPRHLHIRLRRRRVAGGMVVHHDDRGGG
jgi:hypothetical protein